jgi:hypothetical protein
VTRTLAPYMSVDTAYVYPAFCYFARSGSVMCAIDGFDEAVPEITQAGFLDLFTELAEVLSAESAVVMTSRVSFLEDSPQVRRLMDGTNLISEKLVQQLHAQGVDPLRVPRFSVLRLRDDSDGSSFLAAGLQGTGNRAADGDQDRKPDGSLADLLWQHLAETAGTALLPRMTEYFGLALLRGQSVFSLADLFNELGTAAFTAGRIDFARFKLAPLFRQAPLPAPAGQPAVAFRHAAYQELLAAEYLRAPERRDTAMAEGTRPRLTEQVRDFLHRRSRAGALAGDCVLPPGAYLVGPGHHLMLRRISHPVRFDRYPVTVERYNRFLAAVARHGSGRWDHPGTPAGHTHQPWAGRLRIPGYYTDPTYGNYPAIAVNWWSAYAFARFDGKRLPTSLEWEAAARGTDGRLFPWGDDIDITRVNCADAWSDQPLVTYDAWRQQASEGRLRDARPSAVDAHIANVSPFGIREMAGNVWEYTSTVLEDLNEAVICGGSFDNPYRALQSSSKGTYRRRGASNAVGFRCVRDLA